MKLFKLIKSIDYVNYPSYKVLVKISDTLSNSINNLYEIVFSVIVGVIFDKAPISACIAIFITNKYPNGTLETIVLNDNFSLVFSIVASTIVFGIIKLMHFIKVRWGSNKNTKEKRDSLVREFYNVAIPQLIEVKSIVEHVEEYKSCEMRKEKLLLLQAKYEVFELYRHLKSMNIIENDKSGVQTSDSNILSNRISKCAYICFLEEMLDVMFDIYIKLSVDNDYSAQEDAKEIRELINSSGVFTKEDSVKLKLEEIRNTINKKEYLIES